MSHALQSIPLPYQPDSGLLAAQLHTLPWFVFLDSCHPYTQHTRFDIISALPYTTLATYAGRTTITCQHTQQKTISNDNPFKLIKQYLPSNHTVEKSHLPFTGGAIGFFAYTLAHTLESLDIKLDPSQPEMAIGLYDWAIIVDHQQQTTCCVFGNRDPQIKTKIDQVMQLIDNQQPIKSTPFRLTTPWQSQVSVADYQAAFKRIHDYIHAGDCYQVNLSQCFQAQFEGSAWDAYQRLRHRNPAPFSAFLNYPDLTVLSCSPERFLLLDNDFVETKPIKGTRPRSSDPKQDQHYINELLNSEKDKAENVMIVDLLRNDLSKTCQIDSVNVTTLFEIESYKSVHHLVSTIQAKLQPDKHACDVLASCFPGGSITGAPKIRAMQIIDECEPHCRGVYCGSIATISYQNRMDSNIAIRTITCKDNRLYCPAGGAIVADSVAEQEYQECLDKIAAIVATLQE